MIKYLIGIALTASMFTATTAGANQPEKKRIGVSCNEDSDCESNYCKPNEAHLPGYIGTCQRP